MSRTLAAGMGFALGLAVAVPVRGAAARRYVNLPGRTVQAPFSDAVIAGDTVYLAGRIGIDLKTGKAPDDLDEEIRLLLDGVKAVLAETGLGMDDLVSVQVFCPTSRSTTGSTRPIGAISGRTSPRGPSSGPARCCGAAISRCRGSRSGADRERRTHERAASVGLALAGAAVALTVGAGCKSAAPKGPPAAAGPELPDPLAGWVGRTLILRRLCDVPPATLKRADLAAARGDCERGVRGAPGPLRPGHGGG